MLLRKGNAMNTKLVSKDKDELFKAIMELRSIEECYDFFEDLCTIRELESMAQRLHVAKLLVLLTYRYSRRNRSQHRHDKPCKQVFTGRK